MSGKSSREQAIQEEQYNLPYHYIPSFSEGSGFSQVVSWSWGMKYLSGLYLVLGYLEKLKFNSLIDIGCGDGRFLREVNRRFAERQILGIDYSQQAINLASAMNPSIEFQCHDITKSSGSVAADIVTLIEVLEHIPIDQVGLFVDSIADLLNANGLLLLTVPHKNKRLQDKHFQHFSSATIKKSLCSRFDIIEIFPFDRISRVEMLLSHLLGFNGSSYLITNRKLNNLLFRKVLSGCLEKQPESKAGRLLVLARKR